MAKAQQKKVLVFGTFDVIHPGHIHFLSQAKKLGNLTVSVASDESVFFRKQRKPKNSMTKRMKAIEKLGIADKVIGGDKKLGNWTPVKKTKPNIIALGFDQIGLGEALKKYKPEIGVDFTIKKISQLKKKDCVYCTIPEIKKRTVVENKYAWAFPTNIPIVPGHVLIAPKRCAATFEELTVNEKKDIFHLLRDLEIALEKTFRAEGFNIAWNEGELAGQSVPHFHLHLLPRKSGDTGITKYEPRKFIYRPGSREKTPEAELLAISKLIKKHL